RGRLGIRLHAHDLDAGRLGEGTVEHGAIGLGIDAAIVAHDDALALRPRRAPDRRHRERAGGTGSTDENAAAGNAGVDEAGLRKITHVVPLFWLRWRWASGRAAGAGRD